MTWRQAREADLQECLNIEPRHLGDEIVGRERAIAIWNDLVPSCSFNSCVIESASLPGQILGFGASVFVTADFATREIEDPKPGLNSRILAGIANGESVIRPEADLYNTGVDDALDVAILSGIWVDGILSPEQLNEVQMLLAFSFVELHLGYRLNRLFMEDVSEAQHDYHSSSGVWRTMQRYTDCGRALVALTRRDAFSVSGSIAASMFQYQEPILDLRDREKRLLAGALTHRSDRELAASMNLSPATIKKRWQALFEQIAEVRPGWLAVDGGEGERQSRGPQKRHRILAYVRSHPQELRPHRWGPFGSA
jgi:hypothetical protein